MLSRIRQASSLCIEDALCCQIQSSGIGGKDYLYIMLIFWPGASSSIWSFSHACRDMAEKTAAIPVTTLTLKQYGSMVLFPISSNNLQG
jgi:hypothetical protein